jgi:hypothetical protein
MRPSRSKLKTTDMNTFPIVNGTILVHGKNYGFFQANSVETAIEDALKAFPDLNQRFILEVKIGNSIWHIPSNK